MGGLEVPVHDIEPRLPKADRGLQFSGRLRLTTAGVLQLARDGHFLRIPRSKIDDKSKADVIQKILVMTQVTWMATQCIARKIYGLPLTLLEIHTMVHVVCAVVLFALWISVCALHFRHVICEKSDVESRNRRMSKIRNCWSSLALKTRLR
jgi:hypothetical protein